MPGRMTQLALSLAWGGTLASLDMSRRLGCPHAGCRGFPQNPCGDPDRIRGGGGSEWAGVLGTRVILNSSFCSDTGSGPAGHFHPPDP